MKKLLIFPILILSCSASSKPDPLKEKLTPIQYHVTKENGTEPPYKNEYWDNHKEGIYVDVISGKALFSSTAKFDSGTGWPSFTRPIDEAAIEKKSDSSLFMTRIEIRSRSSDSHLGHLFNDGPKDLGGLRYCMNSASLKFIPKERMKDLGYEKFLYLFK